MQNLNKRYLSVAQMLLFIQTKRCFYLYLNCLIFATLMIIEKKSVQNCHLMVEKYTNPSYIIRAEKVDQAYTPED